MKVEFYKHSLTSEDKENVAKCLDGIFLTTGQYVKEFETNFARYLQVKHAVGLNSCTSALFLCLKALGIGPDDEVITTPLTFVATANAILHVGAKPVFVDVDDKTGLMDPAQIDHAITEKSKAIIPVHLYGQMCDMEKIRFMADKHSLKVIEDAAHCIEGIRDGIQPGKLSDAACFSFYATKNITCGEGGAMVTNYEDLSQAIQKLRSFGMTKEAAARYEGKYQHWDMDTVGYKANMSNIQAALLLNQLERIDEALARREDICRMYEEGFKDNPNITCLEVLPNSKSARHLFTILVPAIKRDEVLWALQDKEIGVAVNYRAVHILKFFREKFGFSRGQFPVAESIGSRTISLPLYPGLNDDEIAYVIDNVNAITQDNG